MNEKSSQFYLYFNIRPGLGTSALQVGNPVLISKLLHE